MPLYRFNGKPRAVKVTAKTAQSVPAGATFVPVVYDTLQFNYGPFSVNLATGQITVLEAGMYGIMGQVGEAANSQTSLAAIFINGAQAAPDGINNGVFSGATNSNGAFVTSQQVQTVVELSVNDVITLIYDQQTTAAQPGSAFYCWLYAEKYR